MYCYFSIVEAINMVEMIKIFDVNGENSNSTFDITNENAEIIFSVNSENKRHWLIERVGDYDPIQLNLISSTTTNKFYIIVEWVQDLSAHFGNEFNDWFWNFIHSYISSPLNYSLSDINEVKEQESNRFDIIDKNIDQIKSFVRRYISDKEYNFSEYCNKSKMKKNVILFDADDIKKIILVSGYLKLYSIISNTSYSLPTYLHKRIYNKLVSDVTRTEVVRKIYDICRTKTYRYNMTDKYMWEYLREKQSRDTDSYIVETFNFIMTHILTLCKPNSNPITYFVTVVDSGLKWFLRTRYDSYISYSELSSTEDIQSINFDNVKTHSYNMVLNRLREISRSCADAVILEKNPIVDTNRSGFDDAMAIHGNILMSKLTHVSPIHEFLTFPIYSKLVGIPYVHFRVMSKSMASLLSIYLHYLLKDVFGNKFENLFKLLDYYVDRDKDKSVSISTTYTLKNPDVWNHIEKYQNFFSFNSRYIEVKMIEYFVGVLSSCKYRSLIEKDAPLNSISVSELEKNCIEFYPAFFAGEYDEQLEKIKDHILNVF